MVNVKSYADGDRKILVIENCTGNLAKKVGQFILDLYGVETEPTPIPGVEPIKVHEEKEPNIDAMKEMTKVEVEQSLEKPELNSYVIPNGPFKGNTVEQAFEKGGVKAAVNLVFMSKKKDSPIHCELFLKCKDYILEDLNSRNTETSTPHEIKLFFDDYRPLIGEGLKQILEMQGYEAEDNFLDFGDLHIQQEAYEALVEKLKERIIGA